MQVLLTIRYFSWKPDSKTEMQYTSIRGEQFIGPAMNVKIGETRLVEVKDKSPEDKYYRIIKFLPAPKKDEHWERFRLG
jgi:hypothetical protein